jgi:hypothetical protein
MLRVQVDQTDNVLAYYFGYITHCDIKFPINKHIKKSA